LCNNIGLKLAELMYDEEEKQANAELLAMLQALEETECTLVEQLKMIC
jgi:hypothetical protein